MDRSKDKDKQKGKPPPSPSRTNERDRDKSKSPGKSNAVYTEKPVEVTTKDKTFFGRGETKHYAPIVSGSKASARIGITIPSGPFSLTPGPKTKKTLFTWADHPDDNSLTTDDDDIRDDDDISSEVSHESRSRQVKRQSTFSKIFGSKDRRRQSATSSEVSTRSAATSKSQPSKKVYGDGSADHPQASTSKKHKQQKEHGKTVGTDAKAPGDVTFDRQLQEKGPSSQRGQPKGQNTQKSQPHGPSEQREQPGASGVQRIPPTGQISHEPQPKSQSGQGIQPEVKSAQEPQPKGPMAHVVPPTEPSALDMQSQGPLGSPQGMQPTWVTAQGPQPTEPSAQGGQGPQPVDQSARVVQPTWHSTQESQPIAQEMQPSGAVSQGVQPTPQSGQYVPGMQIHGTPQNWPGAQDGQPDGQSGQKMWSSEPITQGGIPAGQTAPEMQGKKPSGHWGQPTIPGTPTPEMQSQRQSAQGGQPGWQNTQEMQPPNAFGFGPTPQGRDPIGQGAQGVQPGGPYAQAEQPAGQILHGAQPTRPSLEWKQPQDQGTQGLLVQTADLNAQGTQLVFPTAQRVQPTGPDGTQPIAPSAPGVYPTGQIQPKGPNAQGVYPTGPIALGWQPAGVTAGEQGLTGRITQAGDPAGLLIQGSSAQGAEPTIPSVLGGQPLGQMQLQGAEPIIPGALGGQPTGPAALEKGSARTSTQGVHQTGQTPQSTGAQGGYPSGEMQPQGSSAKGAEPTIPGALVGQPAALTALGSTVTSAEGVYPAGQTPQGPGVQGAEPAGPGAFGGQPTALTALESVVTSAQGVYPAVQTPHSPGVQGAEPAGPDAQGVYPSGPMQPQGPTVTQLIRASAQGAPPAEQRAQEGTWQSGQEMEPMGQGAQQVQPPAPSVPGGEPTMQPTGSVAPEIHPQTPNTQGLQPATQSGHEIQSKEQILQGPSQGELDGTGTPLARTPAGGIVHRQSSETGTVQQQSHSTERVTHGLQPEEPVGAGRPQAKSSSDLMRGRPPQPSATMRIQGQQQSTGQFARGPQQGKVVLTDKPVEINIKQKQGAVVEEKTYSIGSKSKLKFQILSRPPTPSPPPVKVLKRPPSPQPPPAPRPPPKPPSPVVEPERPPSPKSQVLLDILSKMSNLKEDDPENDDEEAGNAVVQALEKFGLPDQGKALDNMLDSDSVHFDFGGLMRQYYSYVLRSYCLINMQDRYRGQNHSSACFSSIDLSRIGTRDEELDKVKRGKMRKINEKREKLWSVSEDLDHFNYLMSMSNNQPALLPLTIVHMMNEQLAPILEDVFRFYGKNLGTEHKCTKEAGFHYMKVRKRCDMYNNICGGSSLDEDLAQFYK